MLCKGIPFLVREKAEERRNKKIGLRGIRPGLGPDIVSNN